MLKATVFVVTVIALTPSVPGYSTNLGEGGCSLRNDAPVYNDSDEDRIVATLSLHECVPGITTRGILGREFVFEREDGRLHVALPTDKEDDAQFLTGWVDEADLSIFTFECRCGSGKKAEKQCIPFLGPSTKEWNPCFLEARESKRAELKGQGPGQGAASQPGSDSSRTEKLTVAQQSTTPKHCKPDVSKTDKITKQQNDIWVQNLFSPSFGSSLMSTSATGIFLTVGRYGSSNAVNVEIQKEETSQQNAAFESSLRAAKGNQFFLGFKDGQPLSFVASDVGNQTKVKDDILANTGKLVTTVVLSAAVSDETLATLRDTLTKKPADAIRVILAGGVIIEQSVKDSNGRKLMEKFSCFYQSLDKKGLGRPAVAGPRSQPAPASAGEGGAPSQVYAPSAPGKYLRKGQGSDYVELSPDGTFYIQQNGRGFHGTYKVQADVITMQMPNGPANKGRFSGNTVTDPDGTVWEKQAEPQKAATAQLTNDQIIKMVAAKLSDDIIITTIRNSGSKFDLTPEALIRLKTAGVSDAVIRAMTR